MGPKRDRDGGNVTGQDDLRWLAGTVLALVVVVVTTMVVLHLAGIVDGANESQGARLGAILTFVAAMVTATLSMIGIIVKRQTERRAMLQSADERERLRLEAAMRAGALFAGTGSGTADPASVASGLLALTQLDRSDLAVALLVDLWHSGTNSVSTETAILVLNAALSSPDQNAQLIAAELLCRNCRRLNACQALHWPSIIDGRWNPEFGLKTKILLVDALVTMTITTAHSQNALRSVALRLYGIWQDDSAERVRGCIGRLICAVIPALDRLGYTDFIQDPHPVSLDDLRIAAKAGFKNPDGLLEQIVLDRRDKLATWANDCRISHISPGSSGPTDIFDAEEAHSDVEAGSSTMVGVA